LAGRGPALRLLRARRVARAPARRRRADGRRARADGPRLGPLSRLAPPPPPAPRRARRADPRMVRRRRPRRPGRDPLPPRAPLLVGVPRAPARARRRGPRRDPAHEARVLREPLPRGVLAARVAAALTAARGEIGFGPRAASRARAHGRGPPTPAPARPRTRFRPWRAGSRAAGRRARATRPHRPRRGDAPPSAPASRIVVFSLMVGAYGSSTGSVLPAQTDPRRATLPHALAFGLLTPRRPRRRAPAVGAEDRERRGGRCATWLTRDPRSCSRSRRRVRRGVRRRSTSCGTISARGGSRR